MAVIKDAAAFKEAINYEEDIPYTWVEFDETQIALAIPNEKNVNFVDSLKDLEPATNDWIKWFSANDVFFNIGPNIGVFSVLAAKNSGCRVMAFEPHYGSYYFLMRNIIQNGFSEQLSAFPLSIVEKGTIGALYVSDLMAGKSFNNFGAAKPSDQPIENAIVPRPAISESLDGIAEWTGILPSHIIVDVDGLERTVIRGAARTLSRPELKSVCIEDNGP